MSVHQDPDWGTVGGTLAALATAIGGGFAAWIKWGKEKAETKRDTNALTLDGVFSLVKTQGVVIDQLQDEIKRKSEESDSMEKRFNERIARLEARIATYEGTIAQQVEIIAELQAENRKLRAANGSS